MGEPTVMRLLADFSTETFQASRERGDIFKILKGGKSIVLVDMLAKLSFRNKETLSQKNKN